MLVRAGILVSIALVGCDAGTAARDAGPLVDVALDAHGGADARASGDADIGLDGAGPWHESFFEELVAPFPTSEPARVTDATREACLASFDALALDPDGGSRVNDIFVACPRIAEAIVRYNADGSRSPLSEWTAPRLERLRVILAHWLHGEDLGVDCPNARAQSADPEGTRAGNLFFTNEQAWDLFLVGVAHALGVEATHAVDWHLIDRSSPELEELFGSDRLFAQIPNTYLAGGQRLPKGIAAGRDFQSSPMHFSAPTMVCDPRDGLDFLRGGARSGRVLLASNQLATLAQISHWFGRNVGHGDCVGGADCDFGNYQWDLGERLEPTALYERLVAPNGCHSASILIYDLARSANIALLVTRSEDLFGPEDPSEPAPYILYRTHEGLVWGFDDADPYILVHTDDLYANQYTPTFAYHPDGSRLTEDEQAALIFRANWLRKSRLARFGFHIEEAFPVLLAGDPLGSPINGYEQYVDYGRYLGGWQLQSIDDPSLAPGTAGYTFPSSRAYRDFTVQLEMCSAKLVELYCHFEDYPESFAGQFNSIYPQLAATTGLDGAYGFANAIERLPLCAASAGGCASVMTRAAEQYTAAPDTY